MNQVNPRESLPEPARQRKTSIVVSGVLIVIGVGFAIAFAPDRLPSENSPGPGRPLTSSSTRTAVPLIKSRRGRTKFSPLAKLLTELLPRIVDDKSDANPPPEASAPPTSSTIAVNGQATLAYWNATVGGLHSIRFGEPTADELTLPVLTYTENLRAKWKIAIIDAETALREGVDQELVQLVTRHWDLDRQLLQCEEEFAKWAQQQPSIRTLSIQEAEAQAAALLENMTEEQFEQLPAATKDYWTRAIQLAEEQAVMFEEIEAMRGNLNARYKPIEFKLPHLGEPAE